MWVTERKREKGDGNSVCVTSDVSLETHTPTAFTHREKKKGFAMVHGLVSMETELTLETENGEEENTEKTVFVLSSRITNLDGIKSKPMSPKKTTVTNATMESRWNKIALSFKRCCCIKMLTNSLSDERTNRRQCAALDS